MAAGTLCRFLGIRGSGILRSCLQCGSHRSRPLRRYIVVVASHTTKMRNTTVLTNERVSTGSMLVISSSLLLVVLLMIAVRLSTRWRVGPLLTLVLAGVLGIYVLGELFSRPERL
jgi:hypothetical protein